MKKQKATPPAADAEKIRHVVMYTPNGKVLIPVREVPPEKQRKLPIGGGTLVVHDWKAVMK